MQHKCISWPEKQQAKTAFIDLGTTSTFCSEASKDDYIPMGKALNKQVVMADGRIRNMTEKRLKLQKNLMYAARD